MQVDEKINELPEAIPLYRVSPLWRFAAIAAALVIVALLFVSATLGLVVLGQKAALAAGPTTPARAPVMVASGFAATPAAPAEDSDDLPYPTKQDLTDSTSADDSFADSSSVPRQHF